MAEPRPFSPRHVAIELTPACGYLRSIVSLVTEFCELATSDPGTVQAFRIAANELVENVVKYGTGDAAWLRIELRAAAEGPELVFTTVNAASSDGLRTAEKYLRELVGAADPIAHFDGLVKESAGSAEHSRLGLGRLRAEALLAVTYSIAGETLTIVVRRRI